MVPLFLFGHGLNQLKMLHFSFLTLYFILMKLNMLKVQIVISYSYFFKKERTLQVLGEQL